MKARYRLFEFFKDEYNLTLLDSDIDEIVREVIEFERANEKCNLASIKDRRELFNDILDFTENLPMCSEDYHRSELWDDFNGIK